MKYFVINNSILGLLPADMTNPTFSFGELETCLATVICEDELIAPLFVLQLACIYFAKTKGEMFEFSIVCKPDSPSGLQLIKLDYSMLNNAQMAVLFTAAAEAITDVDRYILANGATNECMIDSLESVLATMKSHADAFTGDLLKSPDIAKVVSTIFDHYADNKYQGMITDLITFISLGGNQARELILTVDEDKLVELFAQASASSSCATTSIQLQRATPDDIFTQADKAVTSLINRVGLYAKALEQKIDTALLLAAIGACKPARDSVKEALGLSAAQHLQFPASVYDLYALLSSKVNMRAFDDKDNNQTDWFQFHQIAANKHQFDKSSLDIMSWLCEKHASVVSFSMPLIKQLITQITHTDDKSVFASFIALNTMTAGTRAKTLRAIETTISNAVIGQDAARMAVTNTIRKVLTPGSVISGPVFLYGASGVGKTFLATSLAQATAKEGLLYDLTIFNMETFGQERSESQLIGSGSMYGNAIIGELTMPMEFNPNQIFVFDEIEKAHEGVLRSLLTILSARTCIDATTRREVDFSQAIFIFTSNAGQSVLQQSNLLDLPIDHSSALSESFSPEFINRMKLGEIVCCKPLSQANLYDYIEHLVCPTVQRSYAQAQDVALGIAMLSQELCPRAIAGAKGRIEALVAKEVENALLAYNLNDIAHVCLQFSFTATSVTPLTLADFISQYHGKTWQVEVTPSYQLHDNTIDITLACGAPRRSIAPEHLSLPFLTISLPSDIKFNDICGHNDQKNQLLKAISNIQNQRPQDGILLYGEPGTGKTMLAKAAASQTAMTLIRVNAPDLTTGDTESNIKTLFNTANCYAPAIVFIDEFDAIAGERTNGSTGLRLMVSSLLTALDSANENQHGLLTIVAANHKEHIDGALLRPGRISHHLQLSTPTKDDIDTLLNLHSFSEALSYQTRQFAKRLLSGSSIVSIKRLFDDIQQQGNLTDVATRTAVVDHVFGRPQKLPNSALSLTAYHEAGHALVSHLLTGYDVVLLDIHKRKAQVGICLSANSDIDPSMLSKVDIENLTKMFLAGRAAEALYTGEESRVTLGIGDDLKQATQLLKKARLQYGMSRSDSLADASEFAQSEHELYGEIDQWMQELYLQVKNLLRSQTGHLNKLATVLSAKQTLFEDDLAPLLPNRFITQPNIANDMQIPQRLN